MNENRVKLHIPTLEELWFRQQLMNDPATMSYNKGYNLGFPSYHNETGCIDFPEKEWQEWYNYFVGQEPERFYAYIVCSEDGVFIGEVNAHKNPTEPWYEMGIVVEAKYRGLGYAAEALKLLLSYAFSRLNAEAVHNSFEAVRDAAVRTHLKAGFTEYKRENGILELLITREKWRRDQSVDTMVQNITAILSGNEPSVYLYGSCVLNDFKLGWSDIDILVLTQRPISPGQAEALVSLRQTMLKQEPENQYYRSFEGGMLSLSAFISGKPDRVVYWGTSGQRITENYTFDSFGLTELLECGRLLYGHDICTHICQPTYSALYDDVKRHYDR